MAKFTGRLVRLGIGPFLVDFVFYMVGVRIGNGPIGFTAPCRFKMLDCQPEESTLDPVLTNVDEICDFQ